MPYDGLLKILSTFLHSDLKNKTKEVSFEHYYVAQMCDIKQCRVFAFVLSNVRSVRLFVCLIDVTLRRGPRCQMLRFK